MKKHYLLTACLFAMLLASTPAHSYLDPSTGSMIVTAIVGLFASIALAVKTYWYKLKSFFRGSKGEGKPDAEIERSDSRDPAGVE